MRLSELTSRFGQHLLYLRGLWGMRWCAWGSHWAVRTESTPDGSLHHVMHPEVASLTSAVLWFLSQWCEQKPQQVPVCDLSSPYNTTGESIQHKYISIIMETDVSTFLQCPESYVNQHLRQTSVPQPHNSCGQYPSLINNVMTGTKVSYIGYQHFSVGCAYWKNRESKGETEPRTSNFLLKAMETAAKAICSAATYHAISIYTVQLCFLSSFPYPGPPSPISFASSVILSRVHCMLPLRAQ